MTETTRVPAFSPLVNLRDLGGTPVAGGAIRPGTLWRADDVAYSPAAELDALAADGLRTVIDLRSDAELESTGGEALRARLAADHGLVHRHVPFTQDVADPASLARLMRATATLDGVGSWYSNLLREQAAAVIGALEIIAESDGGVLFHCAAGKDRTGVLAAAVLAGLGAEDDVIVGDYAATGANQPAIMARLGAHRHAATAATDSVRAGLPGPEHPMLGAHAASMEAMLADLERDGGLLAVLTRAGLRDGTLEQLRSKLVA
ncbi:tyrosine-protein phosphatase [Zhihengliuella salsuginis]|uniref:Protein-tyrosine-phosphatase n=1 Tax=Zhihengliuella salsuginis TaxID=578222 RepID=A0ABQ3GC95_9MICC|nr:tyrosine-protein phosphatase [Zhihengliuella salsuginis]GHD00221.1 protein-tyrosine-phosphatase [Zhihengliuella salsuginis]